MRSAGLTSQAHTGYSRPLNPCSLTFENSVCPVKDMGEMLDSIQSTGVAMVVQADQGHCYSSCPNCLNLCSYWSNACTNL